VAKKKVQGKMETKQVYTQDVIAALLKMDFEILRLRFGVDEAMPEVRRTCYQHVKFLRDKYNFTETQVNRLEHADEEAWRDYCEGVEESLAELRVSLQTVGTLVRNRLNDKVYYEEHRLRRYPEVEITAPASRNPVLKVSVNRKRRRREVLVRSRQEESQIVQKTKPLKLVENDI
jgi:hypothetical protein